jgi:hypothetical protein
MFAPRAGLWKNTFRSMAHELKENVTDMGKMTNGLLQLRKLGERKWAYVMTGDETCTFWLGTHIAQWLPRGRRRPKKPELTI